MCPELDPCKDMEIKAEAEEKAYCGYFYPAASILSVAPPRTSSLFCGSGEGGGDELYS